MKAPWRKRDGDGPTVRQNRAWIVRVLVFGALAGWLLINVGNWFFLRRLSDFLEGELEQRLRTACALSSRIIESEALAEASLTPDDPVTRLLIEQSVGRVALQSQVEGVYVLDRDFRVAVSSRAEVRPGTVWFFAREDSALLEEARRAAFVVSPIHTLAGEYFKSAYGPLSDRYGGTIGILVMDASADFFSLLTGFRRTLVIGAVVSLALFVLFATFLIWVIRLLIRAEASLRERERLAAMGQMAASVAHEIRNPLGIIKSTVDVLRSKYEQPEEPDELFEYIPDEVRRLNKLVNDFLIFARDAEIEHNSSAIRETVERAAGNVHRGIESSGIEIHLQVDERVPVVSHDQDKIAQVLLNLLLNAVQAQNDAGRVRLSLQTQRRRGRSFCRIAVEDEGPGIPGDPKRIFDPFYTTKETGSGLGLAISRSIVEKHGGWFEVESEPGQGATVAFYLPVSG